MMVTVRAEFHERFSYETSCYYFVGRRDQYWLRQSARSAPVCLNELPKAHADAAGRSLDFLAKLQKEDGRWESLPDEPPSLLAVHGKMTMVLTSVSGLALLAEGSTSTCGTYHKQIAAAKDYLLGLIGDEQDFTLPKYADGIIKTHIANEVPFMIVFLNEIYQQDNDPKLRSALQSVADYIADAQDAGRRMGLHLHQLPSQPHPHDHSKRHRTGVAQEIGDYGRGQDD